jgi:hypothetical protein
MASINPHTSNAFFIIFMSFYFFVFPCFYIPISIFLFDTSIDTCFLSLTFSFCFIVFFLSLSSSPSYCLSFLCYCLFCLKVYLFLFVFLSVLLYSKCIFLSFFRYVCSERRSTIRDFRRVECNIEQMPSLIITMHFAACWMTDRQTESNLKKLKN